MTISEKYFFCSASSQNEKLQRKQKKTQHQHSVNSHTLRVSVVMEKWVKKYFHCTEQEMV